VSCFSCEFSCFSCLLHRSFDWIFSKFYSSPECPGVREGKLELLQCLTFSRGVITSTVMEEKREPEEKERESKRAQKRKSHDIITKECAVFKVSWQYTLQKKTKDEVQYAEVIYYLLKIMQIDGCWSWPQLTLNIFLWCYLTRWHDPTTTITAIHKRCYCHL